MADLEVRHRSRARCEDRIRIAKDSGLRNFPLKGFDQNQVWLAVVALAGELEAWKSLLAFPDHEIRRWEPKKLRMHVYAVPATIARTARRTVVHMKETARWAVPSLLASTDCVPCRARNQAEELVSVYVRVEEDVGVGSPPNRGDTGGRVMPGWQNQCQYAAAETESWPTNQS